MSFRRFVTYVAVPLLVTSVVVGLGATSHQAGADPNPALSRRSHGYTSTGKPLPHASGGAEVTFDEERAEAADASSGSADAPPSGTASALGCANRGTATN